ncbi:MAG: ABC transporter ATP-binding protein [Acetobacteraceae bacterium]|nr:ABC transporter ATP-binding protein [Acetobacteraceae bacterium]
MSVRAELRGVARTFADGTRGLLPTDLVLEPGSVTALLGPSGCGKTTLLRLLAGLARPDPGGAVLFDGRDVTDLPVERRNIGMVFQGYALFPHMTVARNIGYGLEARGVPRAQREPRVAEMLRLVRLEALAGRRPDQLSGGQRQRVALARALAPQPALLLLDEPFGALDAALRLALRVELAALLTALRVTAVIVTHDQAEAMALGDGVAVMEGGRIGQRGTPRDIYERPANRFVAGFVGTLNDLGEGRFCRPEALRPDPAGPLEGRVSAAFFDAGRTRLHLAAPGGGEWVLELEPGQAVPERGSALRLALDEKAVLRF